MASGSLSHGQNQPSLRRAKARPQSSARGALRRARPSHPCARLAPAQPAALPGRSSLKWCHASCSSSRALPAPRHPSRPVNGAGSTRGTNRATRGASPPPPSPLPVAASGVELPWGSCAPPHPLALRSFGPVAGVARQDTLYSPSSQLPGGTAESFLLSTLAFPVSTVGVCPNMPLQLTVTRPPSGASRPAGSRQQLNAGR